MSRGKLLLKLATENKNKEDPSLIYNFSDSDELEKGQIDNFDVISNTSTNLVSASQSDVETYLLGGLRDSDEDYIPSSTNTESEEFSVTTLSKGIRKDSSIIVSTLEHLESEPSTSKVIQYLNNLSVERTLEVPDNSKNLIPSRNAGSSYTKSIQDILSNKEKYTKSISARERPTICPICYNDVNTHFSRHLLRHHKNNKDVKFLASLKPKSKERIACVAALRKQGYFHLKNEKNILFPVKSSKKVNQEYFVCTYCLGYYTKKLLYKHVKKCRSKPETELHPGKNCLTNSQTFMATINARNIDFLKSSRLKEEVFSIMRPDNISQVAKNDSLICLYGEALLSKHKRQQIVNVVSNKIREMGRLLIALKSLEAEVHVLFDVLKPEMFRSIISATKMICGYNETEKCFNAPSLALHMGTNLKFICDIGFKLVLENRKIPNIKWNDRVQKKTEIKDLKKLLEGHWCTELSSLALKNIKEKNWEKPVQLPLANDIEIFQNFLQKRSSDAFNKLNSNDDVTNNYKILTECVLTETIMFNRKRVGEVQYLKIDTYNKDTSTFNQEHFSESLSELEKIMCKSFKRVITGGKGTKPVPILFSRQTQKYIKCLLTVRTESDIVPKSNQYLFANPKSQNRWMSGNNVIRKLAKSSKAKNPELLTSTKFRKHIATTLQLMSLKDDEIEQIATFMGHTKKTHMEFYRLPQDIYQTAKVAKVLMLLEKGKGSQFRGKCLNEIELDNPIYYSSESEDEDYFKRPILNNITPTISAETPSTSGEINNFNEMEEFSSKEPLEKKIVGRIKWNNTEKKIVLDYFAKHIENKVAPKKQECEALLALHNGVFVNKDWLRIKTLVYNSFRTLK